MQITAIAFQYQTIHLASYQSYQSQLVQYHPDQSTIDDAGEALNNILIHCLVSNRRGNNLHTFQCVEFESDLYQGVMRERCFPFKMEKHRFYGKNVKVNRHSIHMQSIYHNIPFIWIKYTWYIPFLLLAYTMYIVLIIMVYFNLIFVIYHICCNYILGI